MNKEELVDFIKKNYCDIEVLSLPKILGTLPSKNRVLKKKQMDVLIDRAREAYGDKFAEFIEISTAKGFRLHGKRKMWFFWIDFDNWDFMYKCWEAGKDKTEPKL